MAPPGLAPIQTDARQSPDTSLQVPPVAAGVQSKSSMQPVALQGATQVPLPSQVSPPVQSLSGSVPWGWGVHAPSLPVVSQASQSPSQRASQQVPSTQKPLVQSVPVRQVSPSAQVGQVPPPQSTSVSAPFCCSSTHSSTTQAPTELQTRSSGQSSSVRHSTQLPAPSQISPPCSVQAVPAVAFSAPQTSFTQVRERQVVSPPGQSSGTVHPPVPPAPPTSPPVPPVPPVPPPDPPVPWPLKNESKSCVQAPAATAKAPTATQRRFLMVVLSSAAGDSGEPSATTCSTYHGGW